MLVFGTRPEAIKMCPLVREFKKFPEEFETTVCVTGQHREMLDQVLQLFQVIPDYDLNIMKAGQDLTDITSSILFGMREVFKKNKPDIVLVHGDTTTSMATALAAFYQRIPVGHVEAGLRTMDIYSPWPEEINRQLTGRIAEYNFAPTPLAKRNLEAEHARGEIIVTGNTVIDAIQYIVKKMDEDHGLVCKTIESIRMSGYDNITSDRRRVLVTGHRRENFGDGFLHICKAIKYLAEHYPDVDFIYPMHPNPNVRKSIMDVFAGRKSQPANLYLIEPLQYLEFVLLMKKSSIILTDSGGIQEEAPGLGKPVLVMRDTTERPEAVESGTARLVGSEFDRIVSGLSELLDDTEAYSRMSKAVNPYGDGNASTRIVKSFIQSR